MEDEIPLIIRGACSASEFGTLHNPDIFNVFFILPVSICKKINRIRKRFLWGCTEMGKEKLHLVQWGQICWPKEEGGLGVLDLRIFNMALTMKWWWNILANKEGTLQKLIAKKLWPI